MIEELLSHIFAKMAKITIQWYPTKKFSFSRV